MMRTVALAALLVSASDQVGSPAALSPRITISLPTRWMVDGGKANFENFRYVVTREGSPTPVMTITLIGSVPGAQPPLHPTSICISGLRGVTGVDAGMRKTVLELPKGYGAASADHQLAFVYADSDRDAEDVLRSTRLTPALPPCEPAVRALTPRERYIPPDASRV